MRRTHVGTVVIFLAAAALIAATGAFAATPQQIYRDYADNGRLDGNYAAADLERALTNAAVQAYTKPGTGGLKPAVEEEIKNGTSGGSGTSGGAGGGTAGGQAGGGTSPVQSSGGLPFTGLDLSLIVLGALGLVLLGTALRRVAKQRS